MAGRYRRPGKKTGTSQCKKKARREREREMRVSVKKSRRYTANGASLDVRKPAGRSSRESGIAAIQYAPVASRRKTDRLPAPKKLRPSTNAGSHFGKGSVTRTGGFWERHKGVVDGISDALDDVARKKKKRKRESTRSHVAFNSLTDGSKKAVTGAEISTKGKEPTRPGRRLRGTVGSFRGDKGGQARYLSGKRLVHQRRRLKQGRPPAGHRQRSSPNDRSIQEHQGM